MTTTREAWLLDAAELMRPMFAEHGAELPAIRVSVGFPKGGRGKSSHAIGQCWASACSADGTHEVFISPALVEPARVLDVLAHELAHAAVGCEHGHKRPFTRLARTIGLDGKPTATVAGEGFKTWLAVGNVLGVLGSYPHAALTPASGGPAKQSTRMLKIECGACGFVARTTRKWLEEVGAPTCACGHDEPMMEDTKP